MRQIVKHMTEKQVDQMVLLRYHQRVESPKHPAYVTYSTIGKVFGISGSSVRSLVLHRFQELANERIKTRWQSKLEKALPIRKRYGMRFLKPEHINFLLADDTLHK